MKFEVSNDLSFLANTLKKDLFTGSLFDQKLLILPSEQIKAWLIKNLLESDLDIVSGIQFSTLYKSIPYLLRLVKENEINFLSKLEIKLLIAHFLNEMHENQEDATLSSYLSNDKRQRLIYLSDVISDLFQNYSIYGADSVSAWKHPKSWQEKLFFKIFYETNFSFPLKELPLKTSKKLDLKVYLFAFTYLPELYFDFFHDLKKAANVFIYYPRATSGFWEDIQSEKQQRFICRKYFNDLQDWTLKMFETNAFLAHFGGLGKLYEKTIGNYDLDISENYFEKEQKTLLNTFQKHILTLDELDDAKSYEVEEESNTISIQSIEGSKLEEIKVAYEKIQSILSDGRTKLSDILVIAPNINQYINQIKAVFDRKNGAIDFKINDVELLNISHLAKGLEQIFNLSNSDWTIDEIFTILDNPLVQLRYQIEKQDIEYFQKILDKTRLRFSYNKKHKKELVGYENEFGTWEESFQKIIMAYATFPSEFPFDDYPQLFLHISQSDLQKIEPFFLIIKSLYDDFVDVKQNSLQSLNFYASLLGDFIQKYFLVIDEPVERLAFDFLQAFCSKLKRLDQTVSISFQHFKVILIKEFNQKTTTLHAHLCEAVQFGSFGHDKWHPAEHVFMIGMHSGALKVGGKKSSLNLLNDKSFPSKTQFERFAFLNAIINAKKSLWISYPSQAPDSDGANNLPSLFVKELSSFLNKHYKVNQHTFEAWNLRSFKKVSKTSVKQQQNSRLLSINYPSSSAISKNIEISTYDLSLLAKNPIGFYLQKKHFVTLLDEYSAVEEDFFLSPLNKAILTQENIISKKDLEHKQLNDRLPIGIFQDIAINQVSSEVQNFKKKALHFNIDFNEFVDIELSGNTSQIIVEKQKMYLPAITFDLENRRISIVGKIRNVHPKGLVLFKENNIYEQIKNWPTMLLFSLLAEQTNAFSKDVFFLKSGVQKNLSKIDVSKSLKEYVGYFLVASENIFPFSRSFVQGILKNDIEVFYESFNQLLNKELKYQDPFEKWFVKYFTPKFDPLIFLTWSNYLNNVFHSVTNEL